jgi:hypothetical protein
MGQAEWSGGRQYLCATEVLVLAWNHSDPVPTHGPMPVALVKMPLHDVAVVQVLSRKALL